jgi:hypothetical protein
MESTRSNLPVITPQQSRINPSHILFRIRIGTIMRNETLRLRQMRQTPSMQLTGIQLHIDSIGLTGNLNHFRTTIIDRHLTVLFPGPFQSKLPFDRVGLIGIHGSVPPVGEDLFTDWMTIPGHSTGIETHGVTNFLDESTPPTGSNGEQDSKLIFEIQ